MNSIKSTLRPLYRAGVVLLLIAVGAASFFERVSQAAPRKKHSVTAKAVYAVDYTNRRVILSRNSRLKLHPASTVKLLTALTAIELLGLKKKVVVSKNAVNVIPTKAGLRRGVSYSVRDLVRVLVATSANDAGVALAEAAAGSEEEFGHLMNKKARALGARASNFVNATGLPDERQVTTAYDLSIITRAAFSHPLILSAMREKRVKIVGSDGRIISRRNHNKLLWKIKYPEILVKTGYTRHSRHCYAGIAFYRDHRVSIVLLKSRKPWDDICAILGVPYKG